MVLHPQLHGQREMTCPRESIRNKKTLGSDMLKNNPGLHSLFGKCWCSTGGVFTIVLDHILPFLSVFPCFCLPLLPNLRDVSWKWLGECVGILVSEGTTLVVLVPGWSSPWCEGANLGVFHLCHLVVLSLHPWNRGGEGSKIGGQYLYTNAVRRGPPQTPWSLFGAHVVSFFLPWKQAVWYTPNLFWPVEELEFSELKTPLVYTFLPPKKKL